MEPKKNQRRTFLIVLLSVGGAFIVYEMLPVLLNVDSPDSIYRLRTKVEIDRLTVALMEYYNDFGAYPPGGKDLNDDGDLDDPGEDFGSGKLPADPAHPTIFELQLRTLCVKLSVENGTRTVGPYCSPHPEQIVNGALRDIYGNPLRYLADGRRSTLDPATGLRLPGRGWKAGPVVWSIGPDGKQDPRNNNLDDDYNGKVDDPPELEDDICSW
jgi:hypothetical protein